MTNNTDAFKIGNFGFFKDPELKLRLTEDNLFDQISSDGIVEVWFGGNNVWIPDFGDFHVYVECDQTFFWDITDENGDRTKTGFTAMQIPYNPNFEPFTGDLIPVSKEEVFDYTYDSPSIGNNQLICSNLWFYTNYFSDEYYRYNLLLLDHSEGNFWPNEIGVRNTPMNDKLTIHSNEFIMGYRPKPEYMNQLAILKTLTSGAENKIMFKFKVDMEFLAENPMAKRKIRVFSQTDDTITYTLYPKNVNDILWWNNKRNFTNEYQRYLLDYGVSQYMPKDGNLDWADLEYEKYMTASNMILKVGSSYLRDISRDMQRLLNGEDIQVAGYSALIKDLYLEWVRENDKSNIAREIHEILKRVILTRKYFKGFTILAENMGITISIPGKPEVEGLTPPVIGESVTIIDFNGVKGYSNGYIPRSAREYLNPKPGYLYSGETGSGFYKILIAERECHLFCDMISDGGGWISIISGHATTVEYLSNFGDTYFIKDKIYRADGLGLGWEDESQPDMAFQLYNMPFNEVHFGVSGEYLDSSDSKGTLSAYTSSMGQVLEFKASPSQSLIVGGEVKFSSEARTISRYETTHLGGTGEMNSLTIKMGKNGVGYYARRYLSTVKVR